MHKCTATHLCRPCKDEFQYRQEPAGFSTKLGLAKAWIEEIDDDEGLAAVFDLLR